MLGKNEDRELTIEINGLKTYFDTYRGIVKALDGVDLKIPKGSTVGLVGETGCGKSTTALSILRLVPEPGEIREGKIIFNEEVDILELDGDELRDLRGNDIAMTFQDPKTYLNPVLKIEEQLIEPILLHQDLVPEAIDLKIQKLREKEATNHKKITKWKEEKKQYLKRSEELQEMKVKKINAEKPEKEKLKKRIEKLQRKRERATGITYSDKRKVAKKKALETLELVKMPQPAEVIKQFPHELSTGMRQRVMIATMLSSNPKLFIADEPTTALDVTIQAQILKLLNELKNQLQSSILYITHNLAVIAQICDYVGIMYAGHVIEYAEVHEIFSNPAHPYTIGLLKAVPRLGRNREVLPSIRGTVPDLINPPSGCRFHPRCDQAMEICSEKEPNTVEIGKNHLVKCHLNSSKSEEDA